MDIRSKIIMNSLSGMITDSDRLVANVLDNKLIPYICTEDSIYIGFIDSNKSCYIDLEELYKDPVYIKLFNDYQLSSFNRLSVSTNFIKKTDMVNNGLNETNLRLLGCVF